MSRPSAAWSALRERIPRNLVSRTRRWGARALSPNEVPAPRRAPDPAVPRTASNVTFAQATAFFRRRHGNYERLSDAIAPYLDRDGVLYDIGGNIGYFTKVVGERTGFTGAVHLFEPVPSLAKFIFRTLADVDYAVSVHQFGLSDEDGHVDIYLDTRGNFGWNTLIDEKAAGMTPQRITVRRFERVGLAEVPSVIKIDVEGAEYLVLRGLLPALRTWEKRPPILCEIGWGQSHPSWSEELDVFGELAALGYRATDLDGAPVEVTELTQTTDVLFLPEHV